MTPRGSQIVASALFATPEESFFLEERRGLASLLGLLMVYLLFVKPTISFDEFSKLDLRVGTVILAERVEGSEKLVRLEVDLGEEIGKRQIVAGIGKTYKPELVLGKQIVVVVNLEPRKLMGLESQGMLLATMKPVLLKPGKKVLNGSVVS